MPAARVSSVVVARLAAAAAGRVDGVAGLSGGSVGEFATHGHGERVAGVRVRRQDGPRVSLQLVARFGRRLDVLAEDVREAVVGELAEQLPELGTPVVDVHVADVVGDAGELPAGPAEPRP